MQRTDNVESCVSKVELSSHILQISYDLHILIAGVASDIQNESVVHFSPVSGEMPEDIHHMGEHRARQTL